MKLNVIKRITHFKLLYIFLLIYVIGAFCYIFAIFPIAYDDWFFLYNIKKYGLWQTYCNLFAWDNARIGNNLSILLLNFPIIYARIIEITSLILGFFVIYILLGENIKRLYSLIIFLFLFTFAPPWDSPMFSQPYAFNYIVPIPLLFGMIYIFINTTRLPIWLGTFLALILGAWHETYGLVFISGGICYRLLTNNKLSHHQKLYLIFAGIGFSWLLFNPGSWNRSSKIINISFNIFTHVIFLWSYFLTVIIWLLKKSNNPIIIFSLGGFVTIPFICLYGLERAGMPAILLSCCALTIMIPDLVKRWSQVIKRTIAICLCFIMITHLFAVCVETTRLIPIYKTVARTMLSASKHNNYCFCPIRYSYESPIITLRKSNWKFIDPAVSNIGNIQHICGLRWKLMVVPEQLRNYSHELGMPISSDSCIRIWNDYIVSSNLNDTSLLTAYTTYARSIHPEFSHFARVVFPGSDGREYVYIFPPRSYISRYMGKPIHIELQ